MLGEVECKSALNLFAQSTSNSAVVSFLLCLNWTLVCNTLRSPLIISGRNTLEFWLTLEVGYGLSASIVGQCLDRIAKTFFVSFSIITLLLSLAYQRLTAFERYCVFLMLCVFDLWDCFASAVIVTNSFFVSYAMCLAIFVYFFSF